MLVFQRISQPGVEEIDYEDETVFNQTDCCGFEAGRDGHG
jgi:hypothetical protein